MSLKEYVSRLASALSIWANPGFSFWDGILAIAVQASIAVVYVIIIAVLKVFICYYSLFLRLGLWSFVRAWSASASCIWAKEVLVLRG